MKSIKICKREYSKQELIALIDDMGYNGGGGLKVTGAFNGKTLSVMVEQTEVFKVPICFIGQLGGRLHAIYRDEVAEKLPGIIDTFFSIGSLFMIRHF